MERVNARLISIIIPTLNEQVAITPCLESLNLQEPPWEVLVADGGSTDATVAIAESLRATLPVRILQIPRTLRGRGPAYNAAASEAAGEVLLFLHADVRLPRDGLQRIRRALAQPSAVGGAFVHAYPGREPLLRFNATCMAWLSTQLKHISGDQAVFVRSDVFRRMGGFAPWPLMEDYEFIDRLRRHGRLAVIRPGIASSPRRALANGVLRTQLIISTLWCMYRLSVPPETIAKYYAQWSRDGHERPV